MLLRVNPLQIIERKIQLVTEFNELLSSSERERAIRDPHANRLVRWCGLTVHFTINCPYRCSYCYIEDMGFSFQNPAPYPLSGKELAYSLLINPRFLPGRTGTLIAIGSVSEPFIFLNKALDKLEWLAKLGNPIQFSTKQYLSPSFINKIKDIADRYNVSISPLVTIVTLEKSDALETKAPSPEKRLDAIKNLRDAGFSPILFLRPLIPGINVQEAEFILKAAKDSGAVGVVLGGFRVTRKIISRLESAGFSTIEIRYRVKRIDNIQRTVPLPEKSIIMKKAKESKLITWLSACCANSWIAKVPCPSACFIKGPCTQCPNNCNYPRDVPDKHEVEKALARLGIKAQVRGEKIMLLNYPFRGVDMMVRNLSRRIPVVKKKLRRKK